jgi:hypothetical protein
MRVLEINRYGPPAEALEINTEVPIPSPSVGELLIEVKPYRSAPRAFLSLRNERTCAGITDNKVEHAIKRVMRVLFAA